MRRRIFRSLAAPLAVLSMMLAAAVSAGGQAPSTRKNGPAPKNEASKSTSPRTAWGDPDLQGTWNNGTITPLERARDAGEKELLSREEEAEVNEQSDTRAERRPSDRAQDLELAYDQVWWDRGASIGRTSLIIDPKDGRLPPLTPDGQKMVDARAAARRTRGFADSWVDRPLQERCILYHGVPPLPTGYNNNYEIAQAPGLVAILHEEIHEVRLIHLDGRPHIGASIRQWLGDTRGHWEGETLVVETTNYHKDATFRFPADAATLRVVERFRRVGPDAIDYQFTVDNRTMYTRPWTATLPMRKSDGKIYEYACHEGNYGLANVLGGHRAQEKAAEEAAKKERK
jgi:hypothetical protein